MVVAGRYFWARRGMAGVEDMKNTSPPALTVGPPRPQPAAAKTSVPVSNDVGPAPHIWQDEWAVDLDHSTQNEGAPCTVPGTNVVVFEAAKPPQAVLGSGRQFTESPLKSILTDINARAISPRQMQKLSLELYAGGIISWEEHAALAFQPDLHPDFARTIGALTGEKPLPDQPRDFVREWEQKLDFERRFAPATSRAKEHALHILSVLRRIESPASLLT